MTTVQKSFAAAGAIVVLAVIGVLVLSKPHSMMFAKPPPGSMKAGAAPMAMKQETPPANAMRQEAPPVNAMKQEAPPANAMKAATPAAAGATQAAPVPTSVSDCSGPDGMPPAAPDGATATATEMHAAHDKIQGYVNQLEVYQACRINEANHAAADVPRGQREAWIDQGNGAVDEANLLARAFAAQEAAFKTAHPGQ